MMANKAQHWVCTLILSVGLGVLPAQAAPPAQASQPDQAFVMRSGSTLILGGRPFRFAGADVDWLGLSSDTYYQPDITYPSPAEVDDALATVVEMGGTVVRSHTLGISVGCPQCIAPAGGVVNEAALRRVDFALKRAADHNLKVIIPLLDGVGFGCHKKEDGTFADVFYYGNACAFVAWGGETEQERFYSSESVKRIYKDYVAQILNRVNSYTGVRYKDDPTILAWENCNACGFGANPPVVIAWVGEMAAYIKSIDSKHLLIDDSALLRFSQAGGYVPADSIDVICNQYYPYWDKLMTSFAKRPIDSGPSGLKKDAAAANAGGRPMIACEFGWDPANWQSKAGLDDFLQSVQQTPGVAGALFWNLEAHASDHGWMPVHGPAKPGLHTAQEDLVPGGDWWAFYYTGRDTRWNSATDMYERGQSIRTFAYAMSGRAVPPRLIPGEPQINNTLGGLVRWHGSVGASTYSVERASSKSGPWTTGCDRCATDESGQWQDPTISAQPVWYRVVPYNPDGAKGNPSKPVARRDL